MDGKNNKENKERSRTVSGCVCRAGLTVDTARPIRPPTVGGGARCLCWGEATVSMERGSTDQSSRLSPSVSRKEVTFYPDSLRRPTSPVDSLRNGGGLVPEHIQPL